MSCERINNKAPTLETGWGFVLLEAVIFENVDVNSVSLPGFGFHMVLAPM